MRLFDSKLNSNEIKQKLIIFLCLLNKPGADCSINVNECEENSPCQHNSTCIDHSPYYECICLAGYKGIHCEEDIQDCKLMK